jgi:hypothetical protein
VKVNTVASPTSKRPAQKLQLLLPVSQEKAASPRHTLSSPSRHPQLSPSSPPGSDGTHSISSLSQHSSDAHHRDSIPHSDISVIHAHQEGASTSAPQGPFALEAARPIPNVSEKFQKYWQIKPKYVTETIGSLKDHLLAARTKAKDIGAPVDHIDAQFRAIPPSLARVYTSHQWKHMPNQDEAKSWERAFEISHDHFFHPKATQREITAQDVEATITESKETLKRAHRRAIKLNDGSTAETHKDIEELRKIIPRPRSGKTKVFMPEDLKGTAKLKSAQRQKWEHMHELTHHRVNGKRQKLESTQVSSAPPKRAA